ncbi:MAG: undecaprenyl-diphosphatase, partial [Methylococcaceae bacterium]|nr:undecaprenyl-diphosphatase [Methylococcaceae bacterium]
MDITLIIKALIMGVVEGLTEFGVNRLIATREILIVRVASANIEAFKIALDDRI